MSGVVEQSRGFGILYVVATPLGNLGDLSLRAREILSKVDVIAAEDTRVTKHLFMALNISSQRIVSLHEHNESVRTPQLLDLLKQGQSVALVSDAGTPLISDPGFRLVRSARESNILVSPVPGPSALIAALSVAGLPSDRFVFEGFLPAKQSARRERLQILQDERRTLIFYESTHRIIACLDDLCHILGTERKGVIAKELTKRFEHIESGTLSQLYQWVTADSNRTKGEFVILLEGSQTSEHDKFQRHNIRLLSALMPHLPTRLAVDIAADVSGSPRQHLYRLAQELKRKN